MINEVLKNWFKMFFIVIHGKYIFLDTLYSNILNNPYSWDTLLSFHPKNFCKNRVFGGTPLLPSILEYSVKKPLFLGHPGTIKIPKITPAL